MRKRGTYRYMRQGSAEAGADNTSSPSSEIKRESKADAVVASRRSSHYSYKRWSDFDIRNDTPDPSLGLDSRASVWPALNPTDGASNSNGSSGTSARNELLAKLQRGSSDESDEDEEDNEIQWIGVSESTESAALQAVHEALRELEDRLDRFYNLPPICVPFNARPHQPTAAIDMQYRFYSNVDPQQVALMIRRCLEGTGDLVVAAQHQVPQTLMKLAFSFVLNPFVELYMSEAFFRLLGHVLELTRADDEFMTDGSITMLLKRTLMDELEHPKQVYKERSAMFVFRLLHAVNHDLVLHKLGGKKRKKRLLELEPNIYDLAHTEPDVAWLTEHLQRLLSSAKKFPSSVLKNEDPRDVMKPKEALIWLLDEFKEILAETKKKSKGKQRDKEGKEAKQDDSNDEDSEHDEDKNIMERNQANRDYPYCFVIGAHFLNDPQRVNVLTPQTLRHPPIWLDALKAQMLRDYGFLLVPVEEDGADGGDMHTTSVGLGNSNINSGGNNDGKEALRAPMRVDSDAQVLATVALHRQPDAVMRQADSAIPVDESASQTNGASGAQDSGPATMAEAMDEHQQQPHPERGLQREQSLFLTQPGGDSQQEARGAAMETKTTAPVEEQEQDTSPSNNKKRRAYEAGLDGEGKKEDQAAGAAPKRLKTHIHNAGARQEEQQMTETGGQNAEEVTASSPSVAARRSTRRRKEPAPTDRRR